ncbi:MAG: hypothetical protein MI742_11320 [Desulfobacterales bacterium]|nr:hypothetical protein [Desulfobacterales bacterium]
MFRIIPSLFSLLFLLCGVCAATPSSEKDLESSLNHLASVVATPHLQPDDAQVETLLSFLNGATRGKMVWEESRKGWGTGVGTTFAVSSSLSGMMAYFYNPAISVEAVIPGLVRRVGDVTWEKGRDGRLFLVDDAGKKEPVVVRHAYQLYITPDGNSGAYYSYKQHELSMVSSWKGRRYLLSVSLQPNASDVGRKGYPVVTQKGGKLYNYSGEKGLTRLGLGWVDSYIYRSLTITLYLEDAPGAETLSAISFKWLNAGWLGKNMVKAHHIDRGIDRFARHLDFFFQSPARVSPEAWAEVCEKIRELPTLALKKIFSQQIALMVKSESKNATLFDDAYVGSLTRDELVAGVISNHSVALLLGCKTVSL